MRTVEEIKKELLMVEQWNAQTHEDIRNNVPQARGPDFIPPLHATRGLIVELEEAQAAALGEKND